MNTVKTKLFMSQVLGTIQVNLGPFRLGILGLLLWKQPFITFMLGRQNDSRYSSTEKASMRFSKAKRCLSPRMWLPQSHSPLSIHTLLYLL